MLAQKRGGMTSISYQLCTVSNNRAVAYRFARVKGEPGSWYVVVVCLDVGLRLGVVSKNDRGGWSACIHDGAVVLVANDPDRRSAAERVIKRLVH